MATKYFDDLDGVEIPEEDFRPFDLEMRIKIGQEPPIYIRKEFQVTNANYDRIKYLMPEARTRFQALWDEMMANIESLR